MILDFLFPTLLSICVLLISYLWASGYGRVRENRKYAEDRVSLKKDHGFKAAGKWIFLIGNSLVIACFWSDSDFLVKFHHSAWIQFLGLLISALATGIYFRSLKALGKNYSPCWDAHKPFEIVFDGPYKLIRHPLYLANILNTLGFVVASGSALVFVVGLYGIIKLLRAMLYEETYLAEEFTEYRNYQHKTWRLIPLVY